LVNHVLHKASTWIGFIAIVLGLVVIVLGSYTRLVDAGLGCPDWPGCYGTILPPTSTDAVASANSAFPERPVEIAKTWPEMMHRYLASGLGFMILILALLSVINFRHPAQPTKLSLTLLGLVIGQGLLGMWTVSMKLYPPVVMGPLLGGFTVLTILNLVVYRLTQIFPPILDTKADRIKALAAIGFIVVVVQIALGGWTAANYAAHVCHELPICQGPWHEQLNVKEAFRIFDPQAQNFEYAPHLSANAQMTIHVVHRFGSLAVLAVLSLLCWRLWRCETHRYKTFALVVTGLLIAQMSLGVANVWWQVPVPVAVLHNLGGVLLLLSLAALNYSLRKRN